jgi:site-specific DNA recombinase
MPNIQKNAPRVATGEQNTYQNAALYCRAAAFDEARIAEQEAELRRFARENSCGVCAVFRDNGESGVTLDRPGLQAMLECVKAGGINRVIVRDRSRLSRSFSQFHELENMFREQGVDFISAADRVCLTERKAEPRQHCVLTVAALSR